MILTRRWLVLCLLLVALAGVLGLSIAAYLTGMQPELRTKLSLESLLFVGFLVAALVLALGIWTLAVGDSILNRLDGLIEMARQGSATIPQLLARMGQIGDRIGRLQKHLNEISEKRAVRISVLAELTDFLLANAAIPLAVIDASGKIVSASSPLLRRRKPEDPEIVGREASDLIEPEKFGAVVTKLEQNRIGHTSESGELQFRPVFDREDQLALVICVLGRAEVRTAAASGRGTSPSRRQSPLERGLRGFTERLRRR